MSELNGIRYSLPDIERAIILAPHPDDETLGCGGTIALYSDRIDFTAIVLSNGEAVNLQEDNKAELRKRELEDAMKILGVRDIIFLNLPDGQLQEHKEKIKERLSEIYKSKKPQIVFTPSPFDIHPDHKAAAAACIELIEDSPLVKIAFYEIYNPVRFNTLIDIGRVIDTKKEALGKYHYSMLKKEDIFISSVLSLNRSRSFFTLKDSYYEAFRIPDELKNIENIAPSSPEDRLLSTIRAADSMIQQMRTVEEKLKERDSKLRLIEASLFWRLVRRFYHLRDTLLPVSTKRRILYDRIVSLIKNPPR